MTNPCVCGCVEIERSGTFLKSQRVIARACETRSRGDRDRARRITNGSRDRAVICARRRQRRECSLKLPSLYKVAPIFLRCTPTEVAVLQRTRMSCRPCNTSPNKPAGDTGQASTSIPRRRNAVEASRYPSRARNGRTKHRCSTSCSSNDVGYAPRCGAIVARALWLAPTMSMDTTSLWRDELKLDMRSLQNEAAAPLQAPLRCVNVCRVYAVRLRRRESRRARSSNSEASKMSDGTSAGTSSSGCVPSSRRTV